MLLIHIMRRTILLIDSHCVSLDVYQFSTILL